MLKAGPLSKGSDFSHFPEFSVRDVHPCLSHSSVQEWEIVGVSLLFPAKWQDISCRSCREFLHLQEHFRHILHNLVELKSKAMVAAACLHGLLKIANVELAVYCFLNKSSLFVFACMLLNLQKKKGWVWVKNTLCMLPIGRKLYLHKVF